MSPFYEWHPGDDELNHLKDQILSLVQRNVGLATDELVQKGELWLDVDDEVGLHFTDDQYEIRKVFDVDDVKFCGLETDADADRAIAFLERLIERTKQVRSARA